MISDTINKRDSSKKSWVVKYDIYGQQCTRVKTSFDSEHKLTSIPLTSSQVWIECLRLFDNYTSLIELTERGNYSWLHEYHKKSNTRCFAIHIFVRTNDSFGYKLNLQEKQLVTTKQAAGCICSHHNGWYQILDLRLSTLHSGAYIGDTTEKNLRQRTW